MKHKKLLQLFQKWCIFNVNRSLIWNT